MTFGKVLVKQWYALPKKATRTRDEWTYVNLPKELGEKIDALVNEQKHGYKSRGELVADSVRRRLEELKPLAK